MSPENRHVQEYCWSADSAKVAINTSATPRADESHDTEVAIVNRHSGEVSQFMLPAVSSAI